MTSLQLYNVAFGESVLNDAIAVVLFETFRSFQGRPFTEGAIPMASFFWGGRGGPLVLVCCKGRE